MESPFYPVNHGSFSLFLEPILDSYSQTYIQVITVSRIPPGPLSSMVKTISLPKLSPFYSIGYPGFGLNCTHVLLRYPIGQTSMKNISDYMYSDDIPAVFYYLTSNGYTVDAKIMDHSRVVIGGISNTRYSGDRRLISFVTF
jgi:hypothetical protein